MVQKLAPQALAVFLPVQKIWVCSATERMQGHMALFVHQAADLSCVSPRGWEVVWGCHYSLSLPRQHPLHPGGLGQQGALGAGQGQGPARG